MTPAEGGGVATAVFTTCPFDVRAVGASGRELKRRLGHEEGGYAIGLGIPPCELHPSNLLELIAAELIAYVGSSMHLVPRVQSAVRAVRLGRANLSDHGFAIRWQAGRWPGSTVGDLELLLIGYPCGYSLEWLILEEAKRALGRWPLGNDRWPIPPSTYPKRERRILPWDVMLSARPL